ncbi:MAG: response regulator [Anaerolineae bacterium]|nr:response regulator [Anaerolineae bacterium]
MHPVILLVDDDQPTLDLLEQLLRPLNVSVLRALDGAAAIDLLARHRPDMMFLDLLLPQVSGVDVLHFVRNTSHLHNMYVGIITAHSGVIPSELNNRIDGYFVKPLRMKEIRDMVLTVIDQQHTA